MISDNQPISRCKACDVLFSPSKNLDTDTWEELCWDCLGKAFEEEEDDDREYLRTLFTY